MYNRWAWQYWRRRLGCSLGLLPLQNRLQCVARLGNLGQVKLRALWLSRPACTARAATPTYIRTNLLGFISLDGTGVRLLLRDAHSHQGIENRLALYFQLTCQIVN